MTRKRRAGPGAIDIYARQSLKTTRNQTTTPAQVASCRAVLSERGLPVGKVFIDNGRSGWNPKAQRPDWETMMTRLESGQSGGVMVYDIERFTRQVKDGERLITAAERGLTVLDSESTYDLAQPNGKRDFRNAVTAAAYQSDLLARKVSRGKRASAMRGGYHSCKRPRGCMKNAEGKWVINEDEQEWILWVVSMFVDEGWSLGEICKVLNRDRALYPDHPRMNGLPYHDDYWSTAALRQFLGRPRLAGFATYKDEIVRNPDGTPVESVLPAVLSVECWDELQAVLKATYLPGRHGNNGGLGPKPGYLGTNLFVCGPCREEGKESLLKAKANRYHCLRGTHTVGHARTAVRNSFMIRREPVDEIVVNAIIGKLERPEAASLLAKPKEDTARNPLVQEATGLQRRLAAAQAEMDNPAEDTDVVELSRGIKALKQQLASKEAQLSATSTNPLDGIAGRPDAGEVWEKLLIERQRAIVDYLCTVIVSRPATHPSRWGPFEPGCVEIEWKR